MADKAQTYKNHARFFPLYHFFVVPVLLLNFVNQVRYLYRAPSEGTVFAVIVAVAFAEVVATRTEAIGQAVHDLRCFRLDAQLDVRRHRREIQRPSGEVAARVYDRDRGEASSIVIA